MDDSVVGMRGSAGRIRRLWLLFIERQLLFQLEPRVERDFVVDQLCGGALQPVVVARLVVAIVVESHGRTTATR